MYREQEYKLTLHGQGKSKEAAFHHVFSQLKTHVVRELPDLVLRMEPRGVKVLSATQTTYTERFLGLFFPRVRTRYEITVEVTMELKTISLADIEFTEQREELSPLKRVLHMR